MPEPLRQQPRTGSLERNSVSPPEPENALSRAAGAGQHKDRPGPAYRFEHLSLRYPATPSQQHHDPATGRARRGQTHEQAGLPAPLVAARQDEMGMAFLKRHAITERAARVGHQTSRRHSNQNRHIARTPGPRRASDCHNTRRGPAVEHHCACHTRRRRHGWTQDHFRSRPCRTTQLICAAANNNHASPASTWLNAKLGEQPCRIRVLVVQQQCLVAVPEPHFDRSATDPIRTGSHPEIIPCSTLPTRPTKTETSSRKVYLTNGV